MNRSNIETTQEHHLIGDQVDKAVAENSDRPSSASCRSTHVRRGEKRRCTSLGCRTGAMNMETDPVQALHDMQKSFADDPKLRDRINSPTPEDKQFSDDYKAAMNSLFTDPERTRCIHSTPMLCSSPENVARAVCTAG